MKAIEIDGVRSKSAQARLASSSYIGRITVDACGLTVLSSTRPNFVATKARSRRSLSARPRNQFILAGTIPSSVSSKLHPETRGLRLEVHPALGSASGALQPALSSQFPPLGLDASGTGVGLGCVAGFVGPIDIREDGRELRTGMSTFAPQMYTMLFPRGAQNQSIASTSFGFHHDWNSRGCRAHGDWTLSTI